MASKKSKNANQETASDARAHADAPRVAAWIDRRGLDALRSMQDRGEIECVLLGARSHDLAAPLARVFDCEIVDDVRGLDRPDDVDLVLVLSNDDVDPEIGRRMRVPVLTTEPLPSTLDQLLRGVDLASTPTMVPTFMRSRGGDAIAAILEDFGPVASLEIAFHGSVAGRSVFAHLVDAYDVVDRVLADPETVTATLTAPGIDGAADARASFSRQIPDDLGRIEGHLAVLVTTASAPHALCSISNRAPRFDRRVFVRGPGGLLSATDRGVVWIGADGGTIVDDRANDESSGPGEIEIDFARAIADAIERERRAPVTAPLEADRLRRVIALCETTRLSARTASPEHPANVMGVLGGR